MVRGIWGEKIYSQTPKGEPSGGTRPQFLNFLFSQFYLEIVFGLMTMLRGSVGCDSGKKEGDVKIFLSFSTLQEP